MKIVFMENKLNILIPNVLHSPNLNSEDLLLLQILIEQICWQ